MTDIQALLSKLSPDVLNAELAKRSMHEFIKQCWTTLEPGRVYKDNWHIQAICEHLEAVISGDIRKLIINIPPRHMKSLTCDVAFPCWAWLQKPHLQFMFASYASSLAIRDSVKCRRLINSSFYQNLEPGFEISTDQNQKQRFENSMNGHRISTSVGGALTGEGGDIIVLDDPHNVKDAESEAVRNNTLDWWDTAVQSRLNDPKTGAFIIIMQRVHQNDLTGHILKNALPEDGWYHLCVPAEYEAHHPHPFTPAPLPSITVTEDPRHEEGALLWPQRFGQKEIDSLKHTLGSYAAAGQLQQRPSPKGGGIIRKAWWQLWEKDAFPNFVYVLQSWDTAYETGAHTSYSACTTWGVFTIGSRYHIMIMNRFRDRLPYPELRRVAKEKYADEKPDAVIIEKKASGQSLIQDLRQANIPVITYTPDRDKVARAHVASVMFESGNIWHPDRRWATEVIDMCAMFPAGDGEDIVDTVTQAIIRLRTMWFATNDEDEDEPPEIPEREATIIPFPEAAIYG
jgi:predicted phage terminase large subunit-like protein